MLRHESIVKEGRDPVHFLRFDVFYFGRKPVGTFGGDLRGFYQSLYGVLRVFYSLDALRQKLVALAGDVLLRDLSFAQLNGIHKHLVRLGCRDRHLGGVIIKDKVALLIFDPAVLRSLGAFLESK